MSTLIYYDVPVGIKGSGWTMMINSLSYCRSCKNRSGGKPRSNCKSDEHKRYYEKEKDLTAKYMKRRRWEARNELFDFLGGRLCKKCGLTDIRLLTVNHKNGGGTRHHKRLGSRFEIVLLEDLRNGKEKKDDYDVLCANCQVLYEYETGRRCVPI